MCPACACFPEKCPGLGVCEANNPQILHITGRTAFNSQRRAEAGFWREWLWIQTY